MAQLTVEGVADISYIVPSYSSDKYPLTAVAELPGIFDTECQGSLAFYKISHNGGILETKEFGPNQLRPLVTIALPAYQIQLATSRDVKTAKTYHLAPDEVSVDALRYLDLVEKIRRGSGPDIEESVAEVEAAL